MTDTRLAAEGIEVALDRGLGHLSSFAVLRDGRRIDPFARVEWADEPPDSPRFPPDMAPHLGRMSKDFFCAPFSTDDVEDAPAHGWPANSAWRVVAAEGARATFALDRRVAGAEIEKDWTLIDGHPFLYQRHRFRGGEGRIPVAHHTMVDLSRGGEILLSPKRLYETPGERPEAGRDDTRSIFAYPAEAEDPTRFPGADGPLDLTRWPVGDRHNDFAMAVEADLSGWGWAMVVRPADGDAAILIKRAAVLPQTMLWFSNGGRQFPPWNGGFSGVLGLEEAASLGGEGWRASAAANRWTERGVPTALQLVPGGVAEVGFALGAIPWDGPPAPVRVLDDRVEVGDVTLPFRADLVA